MRISEVDKTTYMQGGRAFLRIPRPHIGAAPLVVGRVFSCKAEFGILVKSYCLPMSRTPSDWGHAS
jgi:hypothetical protein